LKNRSRACILETTGMREGHAASPSGGHTCTSLSSSTARKVVGTIMPAGVATWLPAIIFRIASNSPQKRALWVLVEIPTGYPKSQWAPSKLIFHTPRWMVECILISLRWATFERCRYHQSIISGA
jgi:hypothetical protein